MLAEASRNINKPRAKIGVTGFPSKSPTAAARKIAAALGLSVRKASSIAVDLSCLSEPNAPRSERELHQPREMTSLKALRRSPKSRAAVTPTMSGCSSDQQSEIGLKKLLGQGPTERGAGVLDSGRSVTGLVPACTVIQVCIEVDAPCVQPIICHCLLRSRPRTYRLKPIGHANGINRDGVQYAAASSRFLRPC